MDLVGLLSPDYVAETQRIHRACLETYGILQARLGIEHLPPPAANLYDAYPFLFAPLFPDLGKEQLRQLAVSMHFYRVACLASDAAFDLQDGDRWLHLWVPYIYGEAIRHLTALFPPDHPYWTWFQRFHCEWLDAQRQEVALAALPLAERLSFDRFAAIAKGKSALAKNPAVAVTLLGGDMGLAPQLMASHDLLAIGFQLYDDLVDWREDARAGRTSFVINRILAGAGLDLKGPVDEQQVEAMGQYLGESGLHRELLDLSLDYLDRSLFALQRLKLPDWEGFNRLLHHRVARLYTDVLQRRSPPHRIRPRPLQAEEGLPTVNAAVKQAVRLLLDQQAVGFPAAAHNIPNLPEMGLGGESGVVRAALRPRALIAQALLAAAACGLGVEPDLLAAERSCLLQSQAANLGWSYAPALPLLPANADDLGHLLPVLLGTPEGEAATAPALAYLAERQAQLPTFLVGDSHGPQLSLQTLQLLGGEGPDPEVKANLLAGLLLIPGDRFAVAIRTGATQIARMQRPDGSWPSRWYLDAHYPVYACCRLLGQTGFGEQALARAEEWLQSGQQPDGGWGTPQATALAVLTLQALPGERPGRRQAYDRGISYLLATQRPDGSWPASPFLTMGLRLPGRAPTLPIYQSGLLTTAFALRALLTQVAPVVGRRSSHGT